MMKIFHANIAVAGGGLEQYLSQLFRELNLRGHENVLLYGEKYEGAVKAPKANIYFIENITQSYCRDLEEKLKLVKEIIEQQNPDLVFIHQVLNPYLVDLLTRIRPSVRFVHGFKLICPDGRKMLKAKGMICPFPLGYRCQSRAYSSRCMPRNLFVGLPQIRRSRKMTRLHKERSRMIVASQFMKSILLYNGFEEKRIEYIPLFTYLPEHEVSVHPTDEPIVLGVGRIVAEKGMDYLVRTFAKIGHRAKLIIVGEGPALKSLKSLVQALDISEKVTFPGWLPRERLSEFYQNCTLVVIPSIAPESFGMVGIEAMSYGKPVVAFDMGGVSEWLYDGETGFLLTPRDEAGLREKINTLIDRPELAEQMGGKARKAVIKKFSPKRHVERLLSVFKEEIEAFRERHDID
jgi:glycosyltransferase involved in cell wall biosynthesis